MKATNSKKRLLQIERFLDKKKTFSKLQNGCVDHVIRSEQWVDVTRLDIRGEDISSLFPQNIVHTLSIQVTLIQA